MSRSPAAFGVPEGEPVFELLGAVVFVLEDGLILEESDGRAGRLGNGETRAVLAPGL